MAYERGAKLCWGFVTGCEHICKLYRALYYQRHFSPAIDVVKIGW